jgi:hypothetical protein
MDRQIVYPGAIPLDTDLLSLQRNVMIALGALTSATLGNAVVADGLACTPTSPASMAVSIAAGSLTNLLVVDANAFGSLSADLLPLVKMGINTAPATLSLVAPATPGFAVNYLIEASLVETGSDLQVLAYYNASNPSQPYSGPSGGGTSQPTQLLQYVSLQAKAGVPAATGSQVTPAADSGCTGLYSVTVVYGQTSVTSVNIATLPSAPFINLKLPQVSNIQFNNIQSFTSSGSFAVPDGTAQVRVRLVGGGGGGSPSSATQAGSGGGAAGYAEGIYSVTPGQVIAVTVGAGGSGQAASSGIGGAWGLASSFGSYCSATGGNGGTLGSNVSPGGDGGIGSGGQINIEGGIGSDAMPAGNGWGGCGGASYFGGGGRAATVASSVQTGHAPGSGGGGGYLVPCASGAGGNGLVIVEY